MANLRGPSRPLDTTGDQLTAGAGPPAGSPKVMPPPPATISYHGLAGPHVPQIGHHVKVTIHGKVVGHTMRGQIEGGAPGTGRPSGTLDLAPHKISVEQMQGEQEGSPGEEAGESPSVEAAEGEGGGEKVGAAPGSGRASSGAPSGSMVSQLAGIRKKYKPLRGTAGPMSGAAS